MNRSVNFVIRLVVGGLFVYAGAEKIFDPVSFAGDIVNYRLLPHTLTNLLAIVLPWVELLAGLMLILGIWVRASALVVAVLGLVFVVAITQALARGLDIRCGCFGTVEASKVGVTHLLLDFACLLSAIWLVWQADD